MLQKKTAKYRKKIIDKKIEKNNNNEIFQIIQMSILYYI